MSLLIWTTKKTKGLFLFFSNIISDVKAHNLKTWTNILGELVLLNTCNWTFLGLY